MGKLKEISHRLLPMTPALADHAPLLHRQAYPPYADNSLSIGHTPLVRLNRVVGDAPVTLLAKIEGRNPAYSVKCRIGAAMVWQAERWPSGPRPGPDRTHER
jgi:hypothetical protein